MEDGGVELVGVFEVHHGRFKEGLIRAVFGPPIVPFVHVCVVEFIPVCLELMPLDTGM